MGARGPLPRPDVVKHIQPPWRGRGADRRATAGGKRLGRVPAPPSGLGAEAQAEWQRVGADLVARNVLTAAALGTLEDLARAIDDAERFRAEWQREGSTVSGSGRPFPHPSIASEREARRSANLLRRELGATPASAVRVPDGPKRPRRGELDEFADIE